MVLLARSPLASHAEPLSVYLGVNPLTIELSDHGAPSLFLFTSNYGAAKPASLPKPPLPFHPLWAGKAPAPGEAAEGNGSAGGSAASGGVWLREKGGLGTKNLSPPRSRAHI